MKIGLVSPFMPHDIVDLLDDESRSLLQEIKGVTATPVTPMARQWHSVGHELSIYCLDPSIQTAFHLTGERLSIHVLPKRRNRRSLLDVYREERRLITEAVAKEAPEVLSAQWSYEHALAALDTGVPTIVTCHDTPLRYAWISKSFFMTYHLFVAAKVIRSAEHLVCVSPYTAKHIKTIFRPKCPVGVIPNGLSSEVFERGRRRLNKAKHHSPKFTICSISGWGSLKNIKSLLKAFRLLITNGSPHELVLFGRDLGPGQAAEVWAKKHGLDDGVKFAGPKPRENIFEFLEHEADLMMHPSKIETHGMVLIEAMACGVPVIGGNKSGAVAWTLEEGKAGLLCNVHNSRSIASAMEQVMGKSATTQKMVEYAWNSVERRFRMEQAAEANEKLLIELANTHSRL
jgi:L-malate glycosyltransferase